MATAIKEQVEFYFGEANMRKDKFLQKKTKESDGWVSIEVLLTFNKLKALTTDVKTVADALKDSDLVEVSEDGTKIKRGSDIPSEDTTKVRTLYVKGYPVDDADVTIESVTEEFKSYGNIQYVRLRKDPMTKKFKGSVFVEFDNRDSVAAIVKAAYEEDGKTMKMQYKGTDYACVMYMDEWLERKEAKKKRRLDEKKAKGEDGEGSPKKRQKTEDKNEGEEGGKDEQPEAIEYTKGLIIKVDDIPAGTTLYQIKDAFKALGDIKFVEHDEGATECYVRIADITSSVAIATALASDEGLKILATAHLRLVLGENRQRGPLARG